MLKGLKNYGLWVSLASTILLVLQSLEVGVDVGKYNELVNILLAVLVALGVVSNPKTENKWYGDDKK
jgi:uncharacterized membrane protein